MFKTALNNNIIPHIWKLVYIISIPKPNKDIDRGVSYRPISTPTQHGYKTQHSTMMTLHTLNNTIANGFPCANNHCNTRYEQSFRHNKNTHDNQKAATEKHSWHNHKVNRKLHQLTQYTETIQRQFKTGVPKVVSFYPHYFNIYTADLPPPRAPVHVMAYVDDINITSTHTITSAANKYIQPYLHTVFALTKQNNLILNPDKTTCKIKITDIKQHTRHHTQYNNH